MLGRSGLRTGQLIGGKYSIDSLIARGGMGLVYAAHHRETGRNVAVKVLRPELAARPDLVRRVSAEARLAVEAAHPNVVEVLDAGADDEGVPYVVLERLHGSSLDVFLAAPLALLPVAQALVPIASALVSLHEAGIVHRDIKPSNIFLSRRRDDRITPKLLDFGIAKALEAMGTTISGSALGTPAYMAPEQALGFSGAGPATDIWSLAVVFARCLTGRLPFEVQPQGRPSSLRSGLTPTDLASIPEPLSRVLIEALRFEPAERFAKMVEFRAALLGALHATDPHAAWPRPDTVAYAVSESELSNWLGSAPPDESLEAEESDSLRRPADVETKTLPAVQTATSPGTGSPTPLSRPRRYLRVGLAASLSLGTLTLLGRLSQHGPATSPPVSAGLGTGVAPQEQTNGSELPAAFRANDSVARETSEASETTVSALLPDAKRAAPSPIPRETATLTNTRRGANAQPIGALPNAAAPPAVGTNRSTVKDAADAKPATEATPTTENPRATMGANRSPIID